jgi:hypothetical protein
MIAMRVAAVAVLVVLGCGRDHDVGADERARLYAEGSSWIEEARSERCPRAPLRTPATGDASALLFDLRDPHSPIGKCLDRVWSAFGQQCTSGTRCAVPALDSAEAHPDLLAACAPLYDKIDAIAHATAACSPMSFDFDLDAIAPFAFVTALDPAVRLQIAPLVQRGELGTAARHVLDAMLFAEDYGRNATLIGAMLAIVEIEALVATLQELLVDPRLSTADARAIAHDLDTLLADAPTFAAVTRQECAWGASYILRHPSSDPDRDAATALLSLERRRQLCSGPAQTCAMAFAPMTFDLEHVFGQYAEKLGKLDFLLAVARMQAELRITGCDPRALAAWRDHAVLVDEHALTVAPPAWQHGEAKRLTCVPATL